MKCIKLIKQMKTFIKKRTNPIEYSRNIGVEIGEHCHMSCCPIWGSEPWLISIGKHVMFSFDVSFLTHDGATWVIREQEKYKNCVKFGKIIVGNNCFIGAKATILPGVIIGDNSIVAAGSVVTKSIPSGEVWGGVPAKRLMSTQEYAEKTLLNTPNYDLNNYQNNFKDEVMKMCKK